MKGLFSIFLVLLMCNISSSQNIKYFQAQLQLDYQLTHLPDSNNRIDIVKYNYYLFVNESGSYWVEKNKHDFDSVMSKSSNVTIDPSNVMKNFAAMPKPKRLSHIEKKYSENVLLFSDQIGGDIYFYNETLSSIKWTIISSKENVSGFTCRIATCIFKGRKYMAWFTDAISINEGPYKFYGLPGTIIKIQDERKDVTFELKGINTVNRKVAINDLAISQPPKQISPQEFKRLKMESLYNPLANLESRGIAMDEENKKKVLERATTYKIKNNNPIELTNE